MPQMQDQSLMLLICSPWCGYYATAVPNIASESGLYYMVVSMCSINPIHTTYITYTDYYTRVIGDRQAKQLSLLLGVFFNPKISCARYETNAFYQLSSTKNLYLIHNLLQVFFRPTNISNLR